MTGEPRKDGALLRELYEKYAHRVFLRCRYLLRNEEEARDAMHDVFIKVQKGLSQFRGDASPLTWMTRVATNHCLNLIRAKKAAWHQRYRNEVKTMCQQNDGGLSRSETAQLLRLCLDECDRDVAEAAVYYFVDEMTQAEIGALVGVSAPTLRKRLRKFINHSRQVLEREVPGITFHAPPI